MCTSSSECEYLPKEDIVETSPKERYVRYSEELGKGAYKTVYKGLDLYEMKEIAWNVISTKHLNRKEKERIISEITIMKTLNHDNIIKVSATWYNNAKQEVIFITDLISGGSLHSFLDRHFIKTKNILKLSHILNWSKQVLDVLKYLHEKNIVHRDLKCNNILIDSESSKIYVSDFGLAITKSSGKIKSIVGTVEYMAPEMYEDDNYDEKVDIYAFGMCLLEMMTKEIPYSECETIPQIYKKAVNNIYPKSLENIENVKIKHLITKLIGKKDDRPTAKELYENLEMYFT